MPVRLKISEDVVPITDLRQNSAKILGRVRKTRRPVVVTQRGRPAAVLESVEEYERRLERLELFEKVDRGIREAERGEVYPNHEVMRQLKEIVFGRKKVPRQLDEVSQKRPLHGGSVHSAR